MNPLEILKTAMANSFRSKLRTLLTVLAIFVGAFTLAGAQPQLAAGAPLDDTGTQPQLILPSSYVAPLGFAEDNQAVGQDATIGITDATGTMHTITARITGVEQSALLGGGGAFINKALSTALADAQGTGAPAASNRARHCGQRRPRPGTAQ